MTHNQSPGVLQCRESVLLGRCAWNSRTGSLPFMVYGACREVLMEQAPGWSLADLWERCGVKSGGI